MNFEKISKKIFGSYDIRGVYPSQINERIAERIGRAWGSFLKRKTRVCVGYDTRSTTKKILSSFLEGIKSTGCSVVNIGRTINPITYFYTWHEGFDSGAFVTASHNPPEYSGFKFIRNNGVSYINELEYIRKLFVKGDFIKGEGSITRDDSALKKYKNFWKERINIKNNVKVVTDSFNASASLLLPEVLENFGIECISLKNSVKGDFGGVRPEPSTTNLNELSEKVVSENADFGVGFDGDADRSVFVDDKGRVLLGGLMLAVFSENIINKGDKVVATIDCPSEVERVVKSNNGRLLYSRIGHSFIEEKVLRTGAVFGGEQSSHFYPGKYYCFSDGIASTLLLAQIMSTSSKSLSESIDMLNIHPTEKIYINAGTHRVKDKALELIIKRLKKEYSEKRIETLDGIKVFLNNIEWILIRVSNTTPAINLGLEAENKKRLDELLKKFSNIIKEEISTARNL